MKLNPGHGRTTNLVWTDGHLTATDEHGRPKSPWDGVNRPVKFNPNARADIVRVGEIIPQPDGSEVWDGWDFDGRNGVYALALNEDLEVVAIGGWPVDDLRAIAAEHGPGASVPGRPG